jgi:hypothetical protein
MNKRTQETMCSDDTTAVDVDIDSDSDNIHIQKEANTANNADNTNTTMDTIADINMDVNDEAAYASIDAAIAAKAKDDEETETNAEAGAFADAQHHQESTAVIVLGEAMFLQPSVDVISLTIFTKSAMMNALPTSVRDESLTQIHIIVKTHTIQDFYNADAIASIAAKLVTWTPPISNDADDSDSDDEDKKKTENDTNMAEESVTEAVEAPELTVHILADDGYELMNEGDMEMITLSLVMAGLQLQPMSKLAAADGSRTVTARKV